VTSDPDFKVTTFFDIEYLRNDKRYGCYRTSIGSRMRSIEWWYFQWLWRTLTQFSRSQHFWSRISQKRCILGTQLLKNTNRKPYTIYWIVPLSVTLSEPDFKVTTFLKSNIGKTKLLLHKRKLYLTYRMVLCLVTLTDL